jgi:hypothetical protein
MNTFLFITHLTPTHKLSELRKELIDIYFLSLNNQTYKNWKVLFFGEKEHTNGKFKEVYLPDVESKKKEQFIIELLQREDVKQYMEDVDYIIKLDEDDVFSPTALELYKNATADIIGSKPKVVFDITSGTCNFVNTNWFAGTCIHKKEHAFAKYDGKGSSLVGNVLYSNHSYGWTNYYADKVVIEPDLKNSIYVWVLSPTSISSTFYGVIPKNFEEISMKKYYKFLRKFSPWKHQKLDGFETYFELQTKAWTKFSKFPLKPIPFASTFFYLLRKIKYVIKK